MPPEPAATTPGTCGYAARAGGHAARAGGYDPGTCGAPTWTLNILEQAAWAATDRIYPAWAGAASSGQPPRRGNNGLAGTGGYPEFRYAYSVPFRGWDSRGSA